MFFQMLDAEGPEYWFARATDEYWRLHRVESTGAVVIRDIPLIHGLGQPAAAVRDGFRLLSIPQFYQLMSSHTFDQLLAGNAPVMLPFDEYTVSARTSSGRVWQFTLERDAFPFALHFGK